MKNKKNSVINHKSIKSAQILKAQTFINDNPSSVEEVFWIYAKRKKGKYPDPTVNSGKWLLFIDIDNIDEVWGKIKKATEEGLLGGESKAATAKDNPNATNPNMKVICVYTYDYTDKSDVMRIREELRKLGITKKIPYKTDDATIKGQYQKRGNKRISIYYE